MRTKNKRYSWSSLTKEQLYSFSKINKAFLGYCRFNLLAFTKTRQVGITKRHGFTDENIEYHLINFNNEK